MQKKPIKLDARNSMTERTHNNAYVFLICLLLAASTLVAYEPMRHNGFISYDDPGYVTRNAHVRNGITLDSVIWAFTTTRASNWHPLTWLSHMLDCQIFGLNPLGHHLTSLLFHIANTLLLFLVLRRMTGVLWPAAFVAAAFALHPLHVESVAWVAERKDVLSTFFWLLTIIAYVRYTKKLTVPSYLLILLMFCLGLLSKPMVVTLPFVLLLLDYWPLGRSQRLVSLALVREKVPLFILSAASSIVTFVVQHSSGAVATGLLPVDARLANAVVSYVRYIEQTFWPQGLAIFYPHLGRDIPIWQIIGSAVLLLAVSFLFIRLARRSRYLPVGWLWYLGTLVPVIGLVQVGSQAMADRYTYIPLIGIFVIVAYGAAEITANLRLPKILFATPALAALVALLVCTRIQLQYWSNSHAIYERALAVTKNSAVIHNNLGCLLFDEHRFDEAAAQFQWALQIRPDYWTASDNLAKTMLLRGRFNEAVKYLNDVLRLRTDLPQVYANLGWAYSELDDDRLAVQNLNKCLQLAPRSTDGLNTLAWILATTPDPNLRNPADAVKYATKVCEMLPDKSAPLDTLAAAYAAAGNFPDAVKTAEKAAELAKASNDTELAGKIRQRVELYKSGQPYVRR
jgi:Flp pilus assembly protein TadD